MSNQTEAFYRERAQEAAGDAHAATLDNVRERALRAAATWNSLADKARRVADRREDLLRVKAEAAAQA